MADKETTPKVEEVKAKQPVAVSAVAAKPEFARSARPQTQGGMSDRGDFKRNTSKIRQKRRRDGKGRSGGEDDGFDTKIIEIRRVSRMFKGGRRMRLSVFVVIGDREGKVGVGLGKGPDVRSAQEKAVNNAKKSLVKVPLKGNTIPHDIHHKYGAAKIMLRPAAPGTGIIAGSSMRMVAEVAGIKDILGKIMGTNNKISNAYATIQALESLRSTKP